MHVFLIVLFFAMLFAPGRHRILSAVAGALLGASFLAGMLLPEGSHLGFLLLATALVPMLVMLPFGRAPEREPARYVDTAGERQAAYRTAERRRHDDLRTGRLDPWPKREGFFGGRMR